MAAPAQQAGRPRPAAGERPGHRERLIASLAESIEQQGYRETSVADVVRLARTSRRTFYEHFRGRDACFLALFDASADATIEHIARAVDPRARWQAQVDAAVGAYLENVGARPALFRSFARELPALGRAGAAHERAVIERFARLLVSLVESSRRTRPRAGARALSADAAILIVGGLRELTVLALEDGRELEQLQSVARESAKAILRASVLPSATRP